MYYLGAENKIPKVQKLGIMNAKFGFYPIDYRNLLNDFLMGIQYFDRTVAWKEVYENLEVIKVIVIKLGSG